jgi:dynein assembly factor 1, axonemal
LPEEEEKEEDGSPILTNAYLKRLFKSDWRKYYRTPHLNEKLYLHYKGFHFIKNMAQFTELKCLYFEGNGC